MIPPTPTMWVQSERTADNRRTTSASSAGRSPSCPACGGSLYNLRGIHKCQRCSFAICVGCDPDAPDECDE